MYFIFILLILGWLYQLHRNAAYIADGIIDYFIKFFLGFVSIVIPIGFFLGYFGGINQMINWGVGINILAFIYYFIFKKISPDSGFNLIISIKNSLQFTKNWWIGLNTFYRFIFAVLFGSVLFTSLVNLIVIFVTYPNEWDSMTGHLVKCAYYLQNGKISRLDGTTWTIDYYPNSLPTLQIFGYLIFGEKGFKLIHYISYWAFIFASFGIAKNICSDYTKSIFVALLAALLPTALIQATTTETDLVLTAYLSILIYFIAGFIHKPSQLNIFLIAITAGIWMGHKVTFILIMPSLLVFSMYVFVVAGRKILSHLKLFLFTLGISIGIYVLPTGYIGNILHEKTYTLGSLSAPQEVMNWHGVEKYTGKEKIQNTLLNIGRYGSDFIHLDGLRNISTGQAIDAALRYYPDKITRKLDLAQDRFWVVAPFDSKFIFFKERPYWGVISFGLLLPIIIGLILNIFRKIKSHKIYYFLLLAAVVHFLSLCYSAPYDPIKARYFMNMIVWCLPILTFAIRENMSFLYKFYLTAIVLLIGVSAFLTVSGRSLYPIFGEQNIFNLSRMEQLTITRPEIQKAYQQFDELVPGNAIVALGTQQEHEDFEYPLWGKEFKRKLIPLHPFRKNIKPIPTEAEYLFFSKGVFPTKPGDILLQTTGGTSDTPVEESEFYLRILKSK